MKGPPVTVQHAAALEARVSRTNKRPGIGRCDTTPRNKVLHLLHRPGSMLSGSHICGGNIESTFLRRRNG